MSVLIIIISILLAIPAGALANKYVMEENTANLKTKIIRILRNLLPAYLISFITAKVIVGMILKDIVLTDYPLFREVSESGITVTFCYILVYIMMNIWNKRHGGYHRLRNLWLFVVIFANEITSISRIAHLLPMERDYHELLIQFFMDIGVFLILFNILTKEKIEKELKELRYHMEVEERHYQELDKEREAMAKLRHDYNNQLTSVLGLLHMKREEEARQLLKEMRSERYD